MFYLEMKFEKWVVGYHAVASLAGCHAVTTWKCAAAVVALCNIWWPMHELLPIAAYAVQRKVFANLLQCGYYIVSHC
jgi:hypothetical protein